MNSSTFNNNFLTENMKKKIFIFQGLPQGNGSLGSSLGGAGLASIPDQIHHSLRIKEEPFLPPTSTLPPMHQGIL